MVDNNVDEEIIIEEDNREEEVAVVYENLNLEGTSDYLDLANKPRINNVELIRNQTSAALGLQDTLVSGENIKTINDQSILGPGNIEIQGGGSNDYDDLENKPKINGVELENNKSLDDLDIQSKLISGINIKTINYNSLLGSGNIDIQGGGTNVIFVISNGPVQVLSCNLTGEELNTLTPQNAKVSIIYDNKAYICTYWTWSYSELTGDYGATLKFEKTENNQITCYTCVKQVDMYNCTVSSYTISNYDDTEIRSNITQLTNDIDTIESKIPEQATSSNQLADKAFVNASLNNVAKTNTTNTFENIQTIKSQMYNGLVLENEDDNNEFSNIGYDGIRKGNLLIPFEEIATKDEVEAKQDALVSGTNIKTINNQSILSSGNITIPNIWDGTLAQYNAITTKDASTIYLIHD